MTEKARTFHGHERHFIYACAMPESLTLLNTNNKGADQTAYLRSLVSAFVIRSLDIMIAEAAVCQNSIFLKLVAVAEQAKLSLNLSETLTAGFLLSGPISWTWTTFCLCFQTLDSIKCSLFAVGNNA